MYTIAVYFQYEMYKVSSIRKVSKYYCTTNFIIDLCLWHLVKDFMYIKLLLNMSTSGYDYKYRISICILIFSVWNVQEFLTQCRHKIERIYDLWDILACLNEYLWCVSPKIHENDKIDIQDIRKCVTLRDITQNKSKLHRSAEYWMPLYVTYI